MFLFLIFLFVSIAIRPCHFECGCAHDELKRSASVDSIEKYTEAWEAADRDNKPLWEEDMRIPPELLDYYYNDNKKAHGRAAIEDKYRWPNNELHYYMDNTLSHDERFMINISLQWMQGKLDNCVKFIFHESKGFLENYVKVTASKPECSSFVGLYKGGQDLYLGRESCYHPGGVQHEFMHALGIIHEHTRPDRDQHIHVHAHNIEKIACENFQRCRNCQTFGYPYDFSSVMHYQDNAFACREGLTTLSSMNDHDAIYYQRNALTDLDALKIRAYYNCDKRQRG